jgi:hypothetical protein
MRSSTIGTDVFLTLFSLIFSGLAELLPMVVGHPQPLSEKTLQKKSKKQMYQ